MTLEERRQYGRNWYAKHRDKLKLRAKNWRYRNPEKARKSARNYRRRNPDVAAQWLTSNPEKAKSYYRKWRSNNRSYLAAYARNHRKGRGRLAWILRARLANALRLQKVRKGFSASQLVGCSTQELRAHLESQFIDGMNWQNHGLFGWHIDHIRPCKSFDLSDQNQQKECFHYTNLRPIWSFDNLRKSSRVDRHYVKFQ